MLIVTAPMVQAKTTDGTIHQVREGVALPEGLAEGQAEHLLRKGLVVDTEAGRGKGKKAAPKKSAGKTDETPPPPDDPPPPVQ